jgi:hypothetical protein
MAGPGGVFHGHFLGNQIYKEVPKKGEHAAMQGSARQDTLLVFSFVIRGPTSDFVCHAVMSVTVSS